MHLPPKPASLPLLVLLLLLGGCATMNRSECLNADWRMIGMEDGASGRPLTYIGNHRKACAEFGISPDLDRYQSGHAQGLQQFCTYARGYSFGQHGRRDPNVCPPQLAQDFRLGHQRGLEIHDLNREISQTRKALKENLDLYEELQGEVEYKEGLIISRKTREAERALLLVEVKDAQAEIGRLEVEADLLRQQIADITQERDYLKREYAAGR